MKIQRDAFVHLTHRILDQEGQGRGSSLHAKFKILCVSGFRDLGGRKKRLGVGFLAQGLVLRVSNNKVKAEEALSTRSSKFSASAASGIWEAGKNAWE